jgi:hypothetical protein
VEEIIEGCFKVFFAIVFFVCAPVVALYYIFLGVRWLLKEIAMWWVVNGTYVIVGLALLLVTVVGLFILHRWWELQQLKNQRRRGLRQLGRLRQQVAVRIDLAGRQLPPSGGRMVVVPKK